MINDHRDLICWQRADELRQLLIEHTKEGTRASHDQRFTKNLLDAIGSACRNQSEGFYKYWHTEQRPLFNTARGSLGETKDGIQEGLERGFWSEEVANQMFGLCNRAMKANLNWLKALKRRDPNRERGDAARSRCERDYGDFRDSRCGASGAPGAFGAGAAGAQPSQASAMTGMRRHL